MDKIRLQLAIILYLLFIGSLIILKPKHIYKNDGSLKLFGCGKQNTLFPLWFMIFLGAFLAYYVSHLIIFLV